MPFGNAYQSSAGLGAGLVSGAAFLAAALAGLAFGLGFGFAAAFSAGAGASFVVFLDGVDLEDLRRQFPFVPREIFPRFVRMSPFPIEVDDVMQASDCQHFPRL